MVSKIRLVLLIALACVAYCSSEGVGPAATTHKTTLKGATTKTTDWDSTVSSVLGAPGAALDPAIASARRYVCRFAR